MFERLRLLKLMLLARARALVGRRRPETFLSLEEMTPIRTFYPGKLFDPLGIRTGLVPQEKIPACGLSPESCDLRGRIRGGETYRLELVPGDSLFGDCLRVVDAPGERPVMPGLPPFGWSGSPLLGGFALTHSPIAGSLVLRVGQARGELAPCSLALEGSLLGEDGVLASPGGYRLEVRGNRVEAGEHASTGELELSTGRLYDFHLALRFANTAIEDLVASNPGLEAPPLNFPGLPYAGHCIGHLAIDAESSAVELRVAAQMFLPLGEGPAERPLTLPPGGAPGAEPRPITARNTSLHPFIQLRARHGRQPRPSRPSAGTGDLREHLESCQNSHQRLLVDPNASTFGDLFDLESPHFEGVARGSSALFGEISVQFGSIRGAQLPFVLRLESPGQAFSSRFRKISKLLPPGTREGLVGLRGQLVYGDHEYEQSGLQLMSDAQKLSIGVVDVRSGRISEPFVMRNYLFLSLFEDLVLTEPRTPTDSFAYSCRGRFDCVGGRLGLEIRGETHIPYPAGYRFPLPGWRQAVVGPGSFLQPFLDIAARQESLEPPPPTGELRYRVTRLTRGTGPGAELTGLTVDLEAGRATLQLRSGTITLAVHGSRVLRQASRRVLILGAEVRSGLASRGETLLLSLATGPDESPSLVVASPSERHDSHTVGELEH